MHVLPTLRARWQPLALALVCALTCVQAQQNIWAEHHIYYFALMSGFADACVECEALYSSCCVTLLVTVDLRGGRPTVEKMNVVGVGSDPPLGYWASGPYPSAPL